MRQVPLEHAQQRMQQKWYDLVMAEQSGASMQVLERMYNAYMLAVEEYNRCLEASEELSQLRSQERKKLAS